MASLVLPQRIRCSRARGYNLQHHSESLNGLPAWKVCRPSRFGNPFLVEVFGQETAVALYESGLTGDPAELRLDENARRWRSWVLANVHILKAHNLACFCSLPAPYEPDRCHASILLRLANPDIVESLRAAAAAAKPGDTFEFPRAWGGPADG